MTSKNNEFFHIRGLCVMPFGIGLCIMVNGSVSFVPLESSIATVLLDFEISIPTAIIGIVEVK